MAVQQFSENNLSSVLYPAFKRHLESLDISEKSIRNYKSDFDHFIRWLKLNLENEKMLDNKILSLNEYTINNYKQFLLASQTPRLTINRRLTTLRHLASYLFAHNYIDHDFTKNLKNVGSSKTVVKGINPYPYIPSPTNFQNKPKPAVPVLITSGAVILLILQIILTERPSTPWSNAIAKQTDSISTEQIKNVPINNIDSDNAWGDKQISIRLQPTEDKDIYLSAKPVIINEKQIVLEMTSEMDIQESTSGKGVVNAGTNSTIIYSDLVRADTIINLTPTSSTQNQIIYIKKQEDGMFVVGFDEIVNKAVNFNWEIVSN